MVLLRDEPKEREGMMVVWRPRRREGEEEEREGEEEKREMGFHHWGMEGEEREGGSSSWKEERKSVMMDCCV